MHSQPQPLGSGKNYERASNFRPPPRSNRGQAVLAPASQSDLSTHRSFPDAHSCPHAAEPIPVSEFGSAESDSMTSFSAKPVPDMTGETLKNEMDWSILKIKLDLKKVHLECLPLSPSLPHFPPPFPPPLSLFPSLLLPSTFLSPLPPLSLPLPPLSVLLLTSSADRRVCYTWHNALFGHLKKQWSLCS